MKNNERDYNEFSKITTNIQSDNKTWYSPHSGITVDISWKLPVVSLVPVQKTQNFRKFLIKFSEPSHYTHTFWPIYRSTSLSHTKRILLQHFQYFSLLVPFMWSNHNSAECQTVSSARSATDLKELGHQRLVWAKNVKKHRISSMFL